MRVCIYIYIYMCVCVYIHYIAKTFLMKGLTTLVISMITNLNVLLIL